MSGYIVKAKGKGIVIKIDNLNMKLLFHDVLHISSGAHNKRIPYIIFHAGIENIKSFIYGYTKGDGSYSNDSGSYHIDVTSVSKDLLNDYMYLLSMIGISGSFYRRNKGEKTKIIMGRSSTNK